MEGGVHRMRQTLAVIRDRAVAWYRSDTPYQWLVLFVAWLGWVFDSMDSTIYALVMQPALHELLHTEAGTHAESNVIGWYGGIVFSIFLIGWAVGGIAFGVIADRFGRTKSLILTILIYAVFTGLAALSHTWWELAVYRFMTAVGIGGEWAAGAALVAEVWPEEKRTKAAGILQSAWAAGFLLAAVVNVMMRDYSWRWLFVVGAAPAVVALLVRLWVREPAKWVNARAEEVRAGPGGHSRIRQLFSGDLLRPTLVGSGLAFVAVFGLWGATNWTPTLVRSLPDLKDVDDAMRTTYVSYATIMLNVGALVGYLSFGPLADWLGRRATFALMCLGSLLMVPATFLVPSSYAHLMVVLPVLGFFNNGIFSGFPIYLPELFPTWLRATGAGFCFNAGRVLASAGPFVTGWMVVTLGSFGRAASAVALVYVLGLVAVLFAPETKGLPLPE
jgi:MFS family permease